MVSYTSSPSRRTTTTVRPSREPASANASRRWPAVVTFFTGRPAGVAGAAQRAGSTGGAPTVRTALDAHRAATAATRAAVRSLPLRAPERVLTLLLVDTAGWVAATTHAMYLGDDADGRPGEGGTGAHRWTRVGWEAVDDAAWDAELQTVTVTGLLPTVPQRTVLRVARGDRLVEIARDRIAATRVVDTVVDTERHGQVRVTGRRRPGTGIPGTGEVVWLARPSEAALLVPGYRADLAKALLRLRADLGI